MGGSSIVTRLQQPVDPGLLWRWVLESGSVEKARPKGALQREPASWEAEMSSTSDSDVHT